MGRRQTPVAHHRAALDRFQEIPVRQYYIQGDFHQWSIPPAQMRHLAARNVVEVNS